MEKQTELTSEHYEAIGRLLNSFPENEKRTVCWRIKEFFNNPDIFDYRMGKWFFNARTFLEYYPTLSDALQAIQIIENIKNSKPPRVGIPEQLKKLGWVEISTGGNWTAYQKTINRREETHFLMTVLEGLQKPEHANEMVSIGVYLDQGNLSYTEAKIVCKLAEILNGRIIFSSSAIVESEG
jgi:hypothetical protein